MTSLSNLVKGIVDDAGCSEEIPLPSVDEKILKLVIEYCTHVVENEPPMMDKPLKSANLHECVNDKWFADFIEMDQNTLYELILAANFMDIKSLLQLSTAKVATFIKGKSIDQMREEFGIKNDFSEEEYAQIMQENKWAEEAFWI